MMVDGDLWIPTRNELAAPTAVPSQSRKILFPLLNSVPR